MIYTLPPFANADSILFKNPASIPGAAPLVKGPVSVYVVNISPFPLMKSGQKACKLALFQMKGAL